MLLTAKPTIDEQGIMHFSVNPSGFINLPMGDCKKGFGYYWSYHRGVIEYVRIIFMPWRDFEFIL